MFLKSNRISLLWRWNFGLDGKTTICQFFDIDQSFLLCYDSLGLITGLILPKRVWKLHVSKMNEPIKMLSLLLNGLLKYRFWNPFGKNVVSLECVCQFFHGDK